MEATYFYSTGDTPITPQGFCQHSSHRKLVPLRDTFQIRIVTGKGLPKECTWCYQCIKEHFEAKGYKVSRPFGKLKIE